MTDLQKDERYYRIGNLNKWFMISCVIFFLSLIWTFVDDYFREWKGYQRAYRGMEIESTRAAFSEKMSEVEEQEELSGFDDTVRRSHCNSRRKIR